MSERYHEGKLRQHDVSAICCPLPVSVSDSRDDYSNECQRGEAGMGGKSGDDADDLDLVKTYQYDVNGDLVVFDVSAVSTLRGRKLASQKDLLAPSSSSSSSSSSSRAYKSTRSRRILMPYLISQKKKEKARPSLYIILALATLGVFAFLSTQAQTQSATERGSKEDIVSSKFLSFDLGGSGLKLLQLELSPHPNKTSVKIASPVGRQIKFGLVPGDMDPQKWLRDRVREKIPGLGSQLRRWPDFALSASSVQSYKLWSGMNEMKAIKVLEDAGNLELACAEISNNSSDVPEWAKNTYEIVRTCKKWRPTEEILGLSNEPLKSSFRGSMDDNAAHFEGNRARLEQIIDGKASGSKQKLVFSSWGLGTGTGLSWSEQYDPSIKRLASSPPRQVRNNIISQSISREPVDEIYLIKVTIPDNILEKGIRLEGEKMEKQLPMWKIMAGPLWTSNEISRSDLRQIYLTFFRDQVLPAIKRGDLPKPHAMVFSGGVNENFGVADMLRPQLEEAQILSVSGYEDAAHCGNVRQAYRDQVLECHFYHAPDDFNVAKSLLPTDADRGTRADEEIEEIQQVHPPPVPIIASSSHAFRGGSTSKQGVYFHSTAPQLFVYNATLAEEFNRLSQKTYFCVNSRSIDDLYKLDNVRNGSFEISTSNAYGAFDGHVCAAAWNGSERKELFHFPGCNTTYQINYEETKSVTSLVGDYIAMPRWYPDLHAHILLDHLPPLAYLRAKCPQCKFLLQDTKTNRRVMNWLDKPFVRSHVHWIKDGERISVEGNLLFTIPTIDFFSDRHWKAIDALRMWIKERKSKQGKGSDKKYVIYTSRNSPTVYNKRAIDTTHEKDIIEMIRKTMAERGRKESLVVYNGVEKDGAKISLQDQFELFSSASAVIGPHGGAMANIMWMDLVPSPKVLEFIPTYAVQPHKDENCRHKVRWENTYFVLYCGAPWTEYKLMTLSPNSTAEKSYVNLTSLRDSLDAMW